MTGEELSPPTRDALAELLLTLADDEFVLGFWDSEWTGIAPMLEEDVAMSSVSQDEIGHARAWYELLAGLTDDDADRIAFGREPDAYRHAALMNHPRTDWAFTVARRYLYEHADALRLEALMHSSYAPVAELAAKMRREETYHLLHFDIWLKRLAEAGGEARDAAGRGARPPVDRCAGRLHPARRRGHAWSRPASCRSRCPRCGRRWLERVMAALDAAGPAGAGRVRAAGGGRAHAADR